MSIDTNTMKWVEPDMTAVTMANQDKCACALQGDQPDTLNIYENRKMSIFK